MTEKPPSGKNTYIKSTKYLQILLYMIQVQVSVREKVNKGKEGGDGGGVFVRWAVGHLVL